MARPRTGTNLRKSVTLSLSEEALAILDKTGPTRSAAADKLILGAVGFVRLAGQPKPSSRGLPVDQTDYPVEQPQISKPRAELDAMLPRKPMRKPRVPPQETRVTNGETCTHPNQKVLSMGLHWCPDCETKLP